MRWLALVWACWILWLPITFWFGRVFCRYVCPLGLSQSLVARLAHPKSSVRRVCTSLPRSAAQKCVNAVFLLVYFTLPVGCWLHPWGVFGRILVPVLPGVIFFVAILVLALFGKGRLWCNWVCPLGTIFDCVAKLGWKTDRPCKSCAHCRRCFP